MPKVSIIMPVYQAEQFLENSINSVLEQNYKDYELLLINDGSTDHSGKLCDKYATQYENVWHIEKVNTGVSKTRNIGLLKAKGDYICFLDCDDSLQKHALSGLIPLAEKTNADMVFFDFEKIFDGHREAYTAELPSGVYEKDSLTEVFLKLYAANLVHNIGTTLYRKDMIKEIKFDERYDILEDVRFCVQAFAKSKRIAYVKEPFYQYFIRGGQSLSAGYKKDMYAANKQLFQELSVMIPKENAYWYYQSYMSAIREILYNEIDHKGSCKEVFTAIKQDKEVKKAAAVLKKGGYAGVTSKQKLSYMLIFTKSSFLVNMIFTMLRRKK